MLKLLIALVKQQKKSGPTTLRANFQKQTVKHHRNYLKIWTKLCSNQPVYF